MMVRSRSLIVLLAVAAGLFVSWSFAVPIFEAPDENSHWQYARYLNQCHKLPLYSQALVEANEPPLYYLLIAPLAVATELPASGLRLEHGVALPEFPPRYFRQESGDLGRYWPIRAARLETVFISLLTVSLCYLAGTEASGNPTVGLFAGGMVAFWPQFTFRGMNVSNDALVTLFSAATLYLLVRLIRRGFSWRIALAAALAIAGAFLSKPIGIFLPAPLAVAVFEPKLPWRTSFVRLGALGILILAIVSPWLLRNQHLYGDPLAYKAWYAVAPGFVVDRPLWSSYFVTRFPMTVLGSFIGDFGWMNLRLPLWAYLAYAAFVAFAGGFWLRCLLQRRCNLRLAVMLLSMVVFNVALVVYINLGLNTPQGRYLFPMLPALAVLTALGLQSLKVWSRKFVFITLGAFAVSNVVILVALVIPAYWPIPSKRLNSPAPTQSSGVSKCL